MQPPDPAAAELMREVQAGKNLKDDFNWLDDITNDDCFMETDWTKPAKSLDFGRDGYTGSLTAWHELLQITAPDPWCGLVYVRGDFPADANSILARAQRYNTRGSWGVHVELDGFDRYDLGESDSSGFINLRWPCAQFFLPSDGYQNTTYTTCSFVKDSILYQIIRVVPGKAVTKEIHPNAKKRTLKFRIGGKFRFGCACSNGKFAAIQDNETINGYDSGSDTPTKTLTCRSSLHRSSLAIRLWVDRQQIELKQQLGRRDEHEISVEDSDQLPEAVDLTERYEAELTNEEPKVLIVTFSLASTPDIESHDQFIKQEPSKSILSSMAQDYMGVADSSVNATYRMWKAAIVESKDTSIHPMCIGRSVEDILGVASLPMAQRKPAEESTSGSILNEVGEQYVSKGANSLDFNDKQAPSPKYYGVCLEPKSFRVAPRGIALIKNIISPQRVDPESTFWQLRLLVKAYKYLGKPMQPFPEHDPVYHQPLAEMDASVLSDMLQLPSVVLGRRDTNYISNFLPYDGLWYYVITFWYIFHNCPEACIDPPKVWDKLLHLTEDPGQLYHADEEAKTCILKWYYHSCLYKISQELNKNRDVNDDLLDKIRDWKKKAENYLKPPRNDKSVKNYEVTYLVLLARELFESSADETFQSKLCISSVEDSIRHDAWVSTVNPGIGDPNKVTQDTASPVELSCLNHHRLACLDARVNEDNFQASMDECNEFLLADYTFMNSWDRSDKYMVVHWWDILTSSIIASTLLDSKWKSSKLPQPGKKAENVKSEQVTDIEMASTSIKADHFKDTVFSEGDAIENLVRKLLSGYQGKQSEETERFDWKSRKPSKILHSDTATQSLQDTPELFRSKQLKNVRLRSNIQSYLIEKGSGPQIQPPDWSLNTVSKDIRVDNLLYLSCFDLSLSEETGRIPITAVKGRAAPIKIHYLENNVKKSYDLNPEFDRKSTDSTDSMENIGKSCITSLYLKGCPQEYVNFYSLPEPLKKELLDSKTRSDTLSRYQSDLFSILNDSFVDLGTRFRIFFVQRYSAIVVQAFIYMWHTDSLDAFDDHIGRVPRYFNNPLTNDATDVWITRITISHVRLEDSDNHLPAIFEELSRDKSQTGKFPPQELFGNRMVFPLNLFQRFSKAKTKRAPNVQDIGLTASSLVISGDKNGFGWTFSIISALFDHPTVSNHCKEAASIIGMFIHQQSTGRSLVFLIFLGYICEKLADQSEKFLHDWEHGMGIDVSRDKVKVNTNWSSTYFVQETPLYKGIIEWRKGHLALPRLKMMLSGMEALRIFDEKLSSALEEITQATRDLKRELAKEDDLRHKALREACTTLVEEFDKRYMRLEYAHVQITQGIDQITRLREGVSTSQVCKRRYIDEKKITSVLGVEQNENIAMLTYITIAYLPLGFIATILGYTRIAWKAIDDLGLHLEAWLDGEPQWEEKTQKRRDDEGKKEKKNRDQRKQKAEEKKKRKQEKEQQKKCNKNGNRNGDLERGGK
ncbi:hypothetical protein B7494_g2796 [Chlorociboria aeruginascens]|nr:hypothetical protein B7494_g2796 [Chlorociboria aeruginascens]